jgi:hypothetical protein
VILGSLSLLKKAIPNDPRISRLRPGHPGRGAGRDANHAVLAFARRQELNRDCRPATADPRHAGFLATFRRS